jgi:tetratricopeptide (TPR) repeat protein
MPPSSIELYNDALDALQAGNAPEALAFIVDSLTEDPADTQTWQLYIVILNALGRTDDALRATAKVKEMGISAADELVMKGAACASGGDIPAAIPHYQAAIELEPDRAELHTALALALMQCGQQDAALAAAEKAVALDPEDSHTHYALGHILRLSERKDAALSAFNRALELDPDLMIALYEQGMVLADHERLEEALANFEKFLKVHPADPAASEAVSNLRYRLNGHG